MANAMDLRELLEARDGLPTEPQAARKIAMFAVIPAAILGLLAGTQWVGIAEPIERLLWVCAASAFASGFGVAFLVWGVYQLFGFRPVAILADALVGVFHGLLYGGALTLLVMWRDLLPRDHLLWPLLLIPVGAVAVPLDRALKGRTRQSEAADEATEIRRAER